MKEIIQKSKLLKTILFIDEFHRFNKLQQDTFLPYVEAGEIILIGATTENPSFEIIAPLLSRMKVLTLSPLTEEEIVVILERALQQDSELNSPPTAGSGERPPGDRLSGHGRRAQGPQPPGDLPHNGGPAQRRSGR